MSSSKSELSASSLAPLPAATAYWVAYSGGVDSHVLLHLLASGACTAAPLGAVHVDHGIQQQSGDWSLHARAVCAELGLPYQLLAVDGRPRPGESPEAAARSARYHALAEWLPEGAVLLTAQHRDDQAETLLLQLFRGAGPRGLAAMSANMPFGRGRLVRPLLAHSREAILAYARRHRLQWVEDPSNRDTRYARNFLRRQLMPDIRQHWPGVGKTLARAAQLQADQADLAFALGAIDYTACADTGRADRAHVAALATLDAARLRNLLRYWIALNHLPVPAFEVLDRVRTEVLTAGADARPLVHWPGAEVRRYRDWLYLMSPLSPVDNGLRVSWDPTQSLAIDAVGGTLCADPVTGEGLRVPADKLDVRFRQGGEALALPGRAGRHALKKLFQEWAIPEWERERVPLIFVADVLAAVAGLCVAEGFQAQPGEAGYRLHWSRLPHGRQVPAPAASGDCGA